MKRLYAHRTAALILAICALASEQAHGKPPVDWATFQAWPTLREFAISDDGRYMWYTVDPVVFGPPGRATLTFAAVDGPWRFTVPDGRDVVFSADERNAIFWTGKNRIDVLKLGEGVVDEIPDVRSYKLSPKRNSEWLAYQRESNSDLILRDLATGKEMAFQDVREFSLGVTGKSVALIAGPAGKSMVRWLDLTSDARSQTKYESEVPDASNVVLDSSDTTLAFLVTDSATHSNSIRYFKPGMSRAGQLLSDQSDGGYRDLGLDKIIGFSTDSRNLFVSLEDKKVLVPDPDGAKVDVNSYKDANLQSSQLKSLGPKAYLAAIHIRDGEVVRLEHENDAAVIKTDKFLYVTHEEGDNFREGHWNPKAQRTAYIVSTVNGERKSVELKYSVMLSPDEKYLVGKIDHHGDLYSYELSTGIVRNLCESLPIRSAGGIL